MKPMTFILFLSSMIFFWDCRSRKDVKDDFFLCDCSKTEVLTLDGTFQGRNIYVENPFVMCLDSSETFTTKKVIINNSIDLKDEINSSAYEIDLIHMNFKKNDPIKIEIVFIPPFRPHVLNPTVQ